MPGPGPWVQFWPALKEQARQRLAAVGRALAGTGVHPNFLTLTGLAGTSLAAAAVIAGWLPGAAIVFLGASALDSLDGAVARASGKTSPFGAFLDSIADRYSEAAIFGAVLVRAHVSADTPLLAASAVALVGALLVSYARARAEGLGVDCEIGLLQRTERVILLGLGLLFPDLLLVPVVAVLAVATHVTVLQRVLHVRRALATSDGREPSSDHL